MNSDDASLSASDPGPGFRHPALFYRGTAEYLTGTLPFVMDGLAAGEPVAVAVPPANIAVLAGGLGAAAGSVRFLDMTQVGRNPGRIIRSVLRAFADAHPNQRVRIIGEPIWPGRTDVEYPACVQHEALINRAFAGRDVSILCPYDIERLPPQAVHDAAATHPVLIYRGREHSNDSYDPDGIAASYDRPLPAPPAGTPELLFDIDSLAGLRRFVVDRAGGHGLPSARHDDLELMITELATPAVVHGGGAGTARVWAEPGQVACEVECGEGLGKSLADPIGATDPVVPADDRGRGLLLVNHLADLVRVHTGNDRTTVRMYLDL